MRWDGSGGLRGLRAAVYELDLEDDHIISFVGSLGNLKMLIEVAEAAKAFCRPDNHACYPRDKCEFCINNEVLLRMALGKLESDPELLAQSEAKVFGDSDNGETGGGMG